MNDQRASREVNRQQAEQIVVSSLAIILHAYINRTQKIPVSAPKHALIGHEHKNARANLK